ncbi:MAG: hypothetical protein K2Q34_06260, partial [Alphaproteobacteria bacterium]|nr:hypothetical protein [Alphaproteobacteria bacterium]
ADDEEDNEGTSKVTYPDAFAEFGDAYSYLSNLIELDGDKDPQLAEALQSCIQALFDQSENGGLQEGSWSDLATNLVATKESSEEMQAYLEEVSKAHKKASTPDDAENEKPKVSPSEELKGFLLMLFGEREGLARAIPEYTQALLALDNGDEKRMQPLVLADLKSFLGGIPLKYVQSFFETATSKHLSALASSSAEEGEKEAGSGSEEDEEA